MSADSAALSPSSKSYRAIPVGGLIAGTLDITAAFVVNGLKGRSAMWVLQSIASGLLGPASYKGGFKTAALGLALHFLIATVATAVYCVTSRQLKFMVRQAVICGLLYGVLVYLFMNFIVLPLAFPFKIAHPLNAVVTGVLVIMFCVGLPISLIVRWYSR